MATLPESQSTMTLLRGGSPSSEAQRAAAGLTNSDSGAGFKLRILKFTGNSILGEYIPKFIAVASGPGAVHATSQLPRACRGTARGPGQGPSDSGWPLPGHLPVTAVTL